MNFTNETIREMHEIKKLTEEKMNCNVQRWLDIAFKLDYITLEEKERIFSLMEKLKDCETKNTAPDFCKSNYTDLSVMKRIIKNTVFPIQLIRSVTAESALP